MKYILIVLSLLINSLVGFSQVVILNDNFESNSLSADLTKLGYEFKKNTEYLDEIITTVQGDNTNKYAACEASTNGQAIMQLGKVVNVIPGKVYVFTVKTMSPFKRHLRVYQSNFDNLIKKVEDITPSEDQKTQWMEQTITVVAGANVTSMQFVVYHNWSGIMKVDDFKVEEETVPELPAYYLSSSEGDDANEGTIDSPWKSLAKISTVPLKPGNSVYFKCEDRFDGHFVVNGSGTAEKPITITSYGEGNKPILTGEVGEEQGGDYQEAILVENQDNILFEGLEINNERTFNRSGIDETDAFGIHILNSGLEVMRNIVIRNMTFENIYAPKPILQDEGEDSFNGLEVAAVRINTLKNTVAGHEKNIRDVLVENCYFTDLQRLGVHMKHAGGAAGIGNDSINRNMNLVFRNNQFHYTGGTCILPTMTYNCLIENNIFNHPGSDVDPRMPNRGSSVWTWRCHNTVIQRNQCISTRGYLDSHGIHIDHENHNTFIQYNYMEDCEGGFVEILGGNVNAVYRFNISVNDGWRNNPEWVNSNHTLWINENTPSGAHYCDSSYIYNNTVVIDEPFSTAIDIDAKNTHIFNNIFYSTNGAGMGAKQMVVKNNGTELYMRNNLYYGAVNYSFKSMDTSPVEGNPLFTLNEDKPEQKYQLKEDSPVIDAGVTNPGPPIPGAGKGIFKDVPEYPIVDFYGNPIDLISGTPNIGACNLKSTDIGIWDYAKLPTLTFTPNPTNGIIYLQDMEGENRVMVFNMFGKKVKDQLFFKQLSIEELDAGVYLLLIDGYRPAKLVKN